MTGNRFMDLTGQRYGHLVVISLAEKAGKHTFWWCRCDCGIGSKTTSNRLRTGMTKSCGCIKRSQKPTLRHGLSRTPTYFTWCAMKARCANPAHDAYRYYGAIGISVCPRWLHGDGILSGFECFVLDMGIKPAGHSIERDDQNGSYEPGNCRWATQTEQVRHRRNTRTVILDGATTTLAEACERSGVPYPVAHQRLSRGWSAERALENARDA